jgi:choline-sulfatase
VWRNVAHALSAGAPTWMRAIRDAGYATGVFGKTHLHPHRGDLRDREHLVRAWGMDDVDEIAGPRASARCRSNLVAPVAAEDVGERVNGRFDSVVVKRARRREGVAP